jgi:hypothetical protein
MRSWFDSKTNSAVVLANAKTRDPRRSRNAKL